MELIHILPRESLANRPRQRYELYLADEVLKYPEDYSCLSYGPKSSYRILDNSLNELGYALSLKKLDLASRIVRADEIVIPDSVDSAASARLLEMFFKQKDDYAGIRERKYMAVLHAESFSSALESMYALSNDERVSTIGIPKVLAKQFELPEAPYGGRVRLVSSLSNEFDFTTRVHFLGYTGFDEFAKYGEVTKFVRSMDSRVMVHQTLFSRREDLLGHVELDRGVITQQKVDSIREVYKSYGLY